MVVADGMGGHLHGEVAAEIAVEHARRRVRARGAADARRIRTASCSRAIGAAHAAIVREAENAASSPIRRAP